MKKQKLNLNQLKVKSFVTGLEDEVKDTAKGGQGSQFYTVCCFDDDTNGCTLRQRCDTINITNVFGGCGQPG